MAEGQTITINDKEYDIDSLTEDQVYVLNQINSADKKINKARFELDQLVGARTYFTNTLIAMVEAPQEESE